MYNIRYGLSYLLHRFKANNRHGIHSPFVYKLIDTVIYDYRGQKVYREIENICKKQHPDRRMIKAMPLKVYQLLYRLTVYFNPGVAFLGDDDDIISYTLQSARPGIKVLTAKNADPGLRVDMIFIDALRHQTMVYFEQCFYHIHDDTMLVCSNINCNQHTRQLWEQLKADGRVRVTIELFYIGLVFFKPGMSRENFRVRY